jgi:hypothetical protein
MKLSNAKGNALLYKILLSSPGRQAGAQKLPTSHDLGKHKLNEEARRRREERVLV